GLATAAGVLPVGVADERSGRGGVRVQRHIGAPFAHQRQRALAGGDDAVAGNHQVGLRGVDLGGVDRLLPVGDLDVAPGRAALLRQAGAVLGDDALALEVCGHAEQLADRDHPGAADAGHHDAPGRLGQRQRRLGDLGQHARVGAAGFLLRLLQLAAFDSHEARAEALQAGVVLVAGVLVDAALAAELGLHRFHAQAVALHAAVAAAFAHQLVDHQAPGGILHLAALAAPPLLGGAGLVVNQDRAALGLAQLALHRVEL